MSVVIDRLLDTESVSVQVYSGADGQGKPSFASAVTIDVHVRRTEDYVIEADGSRTPVPLTLYVPPDASVVPGAEDRITLGSETFTAHRIKPVRRLTADRNSLDHTKVQCKAGG